jgi:CHAT domain-containing protein/Tfp pilus assembly protein PilF
LLAATALTGCHSPAKADAATTYQAIRADLMHGDLNVAQQKAKKARQDFSAAGGDWPMKFLLLDAEIVLLEGRRSEGIALLTNPGVSYPTAGDLAIKRDLLCGITHLRLGQAEQSTKELQEARHLSDAIHSDLNGEVLRTEAVAQLYRGLLPEAAALSRSSLNVARDSRDSFLEASDLLNLGLITLQMRHYDEALPLLKQAADSARSIQAQTLLDFALGNRGLAYFYLGDFEKALSDFRQAEQEATKIGTADARVDWSMDAGSAYYRLNELEQAKTSFEQSLQSAVALDEPTEIADIDTNLGFVLYRQGQLDAAKLHAEEAVQAARRAGQKPKELEALYLQALLASPQQNGPDAERMLLQLHEKAKDDPTLLGQIDNALAKLYAERKQSKRADLFYRESIRTFEDERAAVRNEELRLPFLGNGEAFYRDYADFLITSQKPENALQLLDIGRAKTLAEGLGLAKLDARSVKLVDEQAVAGKLDGVILFYSLGVEKSYLWAVTAHHTRVFVLPGKLAIEDQIRAYQRAILKSSDPLRESNPAAKTLYTILVGPAAAAIPKGSRVFIIADGMLNELNFETLLTPEPDTSHYWIEDVTISNANSIRLLSGLDTGSPSEPGKKLLVIGNPVATGTGYDSLVNAFAEIRGLEKHFPPDTRTVITQSEAVPAAYSESKPDRFQYIHFVAHGTASQLSPLDSAVVLSPPPGNPESFKLYAREIMRSPLNARLVTISACYGSGLRAYAGEGLVGLSWAFLRAGSHNVIGALWEVNDASTPLLMDRLYGGLEAGQSPDVALRAAKLSLIHSPAVYRKPLYWGAFQLYTGS